MRELLQQALDALEDDDMPISALTDAIRAALAQPAEPVAFDRTTALVLLSAASKSGDPGAINLAAQLAGAAPCTACGYVHFKCRCAPPLDGFGGNLDSAFDRGAPHDASGAPWPDAAPAQPAVPLPDHDNHHNALLCPYCNPRRLKFAEPDAQPAVREPLTVRELQLIDGMIDVQRHHASQCDSIANRTMAEIQKGWDMERVELLRKLRAHGIKGDSK